jgi:hypothetical protein
VVLGLVLPFPRLDVPRASGFGHVVHRPPSGGRED